MRRLLALALISISVCPAYGQDQEKGLMQRLLKPDQELKGKEQGKKFTADRVSVDQHARVGTFYLQRKPDPASKTYSNTQAVQTKAHEEKTRAFDASGNGDSLLAARSSVSTKSYSTPAARTSAELRDAHKPPVESNRFAGNRPFLDKGKSQKSLERKTEPMTIDEVRELLNKSK